jgi:hypothetical protein
MISDEDTAAGRERLMAKGQRGGALRDVQMLLRAGTTVGLTDGQLLEDFRGRDGEAAERAFAALVERHGPVVLRACRSILRDEHAAEDAFQAALPTVPARPPAPARDVRPEFRIRIPPGPSLAIRPDPGLTGLIDAEPDPRR